MGKFSQANRPMRVISTLKDDDLLLVGFSGEEAMSAPGGFALDLASEKPTIAAKDLLRKPMGIVIESSDGTKRFLQGFVRRFCLTGQSDELTLYRAEIVPWIWFLSLSSDCKIFQNKSVLQIVEEVFKAQGFTDFENRCLKTYKPREFCVQYRETHLNFVSRLLEDEGIFFFYEHGPKKHVLILADNPSKIVACPGLGKVTMLGGAAATKDADTLSSLQEEEQVGTGVVSFNDFNFLQPKTNLLRTISGKSKEELYDFPGGYPDVDEGDRYAGLTLEEIEASQRTVYGTGSCRPFTAGHKFTLNDHPRKELNTEWTLVRVAHSGHNGDFRASGSSGDESYSNSFVGIPHSVVYRPPAVTLRPRVRGTQTATVVGKAGEEIWTDKFGRIRIQFHWDRVGKKDENSSIWVRVASPWAGKNFGMIHVPRMGQEVVVDFLEGDPDQPIILGSVYNADNMPPWDLPANQTQAGILTRSVKGGTAANANALRFEDKKGSEQVWLHAEKNQDIEVENDETHWVGHDRVKTIDRDETLHVKRDQKETIDNDQTLVVYGKQVVGVKKDCDLTVQDGALSVLVEKGDSYYTVNKGNYEIEVDEGELLVDVGKSDYTTSVGQGNMSISVDQGNVDVDVGMGNLSVKVSMGNITMKASAGKIEVEAMQGIEFKCMGNSIKIDPSGITIKGLMVKVEGSIQTSIKGLMTEVKGDAMLQAKGAITMIG